VSAFVRNYGLFLMVGIPDSTLIYFWKSPGKRLLKVKKRGVAWVEIRGIQQFGFFFLGGLFFFFFFFSMNSAVKNPKPKMFGFFGRTQTVVFDPRQKRRKKKKAKIFESCFKIFFASRKPGEPAKKITFFKNGIKKQKRLVGTKRKKCF
jgi:hypothetical protein